MRLQPHDLAQQRNETLIAAMDVAVNRRSNHLIPANQAPIEPVAHHRSQLPKEFPLRASIALAKGMKRIQFAQEKGCTLGKLVGGKALQLVFISQLCEKIIQILGQELRRGKRE